MKRTSPIAMATAFFAMALTQMAVAQQLVQARRQDGASTPLRVYTPQASGCAPLALISPGAGGSEDGYKYLARAFATTAGRPLSSATKKAG